MFMGPAVGRHKFYTY